MTNPKRIAALLGVLLVLFSVFFFLSLTTVQTNHYCTGDHCGICRQIGLCRNLLTGTVGNDFKRTLMLVSFLSGCVFIAGRMVSASSPVLLGVKLQN